jgi:hypothetical protein
VNEFRTAFNEFYVKNLDYYYWRYSPKTLRRVSAISPNVQ